MSNDYSLLFDGTDDYISIPHSSNLSLTNAFSFHYDASVTPDDPSLQNIFSTNVMGGTSWSASNGELTMNTAKLAGLWFGNSATFDRVPWKLGSSLEGNSVSVRAKLLPNSEDWEFYVDDGSYAASVRLFPKELQLAYADGGKNTYSTYSIDTLDFHWYSFSLVNGVVKYYVDGTEVFTGAAYLLTFDKYLVIGDGSGSDDHTTGSFVVDEVFIKNYINNVPTVSNNTLTIAEDTDRIFVASDFNFSDVDPGDSLQAVWINALPTDGTLYIDANNNSIVDTGESFSVGSSVTIAAINSGQFKFKPDLNENDTPYTSFNFFVSDGISSSVNPATLTLNVTPVNDVNNQSALSFDGVDDYVEIPHDESLSLTNFTIETWVNPSQIKNAYQPLITKEASNGYQRNYGLFIRPNDLRVNFSFVDGNGSTWRGSESQNSLKINEWNHIAMTYDGSKFNFYLNGIQF